MLADDYALLQDRIVSVVGDVDKAAFTFKRLEQISGKTASHRKSKNNIYQSGNKCIPLGKGVAKRYTWY